MPDPMTKHELLRVPGSEHLYRHASNPKILFSEGVKQIADRANAYWLLDEIAEMQIYDHQVASEQFQVWKLVVNDDKSADLFCENEYTRVIYSKEISSANFPGRGITLWLSENTILLPGEY